MKKFTPVNVMGSHKFSGKNSFFGSGFPGSSVPSAPFIPVTVLNNKIGNNLSEVINMGLSDSTWNKYRTAHNHLKRVEEETGVSMNIPLSDGQLLWYVSYLGIHRNVDSKTIDNYLSGLRMLHISLGFSVPTLKSPIVKMAIKGTKRRQNLKDELKVKKKRRAISLPILEYISHQIAVDPVLSVFDKQLYFAVCLTGFFGSFRMGEIVSRQAKSFDSQFTLLTEDVSFNIVPFPDGSSVKSFRFRIKSPKIEKVSVGDEVEVFEVDSPMDPIAALSRYIGMLEERGWQDPVKPLFRRDNGMCITRDHLNKFLKNKLSPLLASDDLVSCHSFRAGISSHMTGWGFSSDEIMGQGRWSSSSWELYCKLPLTRRRFIASKLACHLQSI